MHPNGYFQFLRLKSKSGSVIFPIKNFYSGNTGKRGQNQPNGGQNLPLQGPMGLRGGHFGPGEP